MSFIEAVERAFVNDPSLLALAAEARAAGLDPLEAMAEADRAAAQEILTKPLATQSPTAASVARLVQRLEHWVAAETEIRLSPR